MKARALTFSLCGLLLASCMPSRSIPSGVYKSGSEKIAIEGERAVLDVLVAKESGLEMQHREYGYFVDKAGRITWRTITSNDALMGVGRYDWTWNGSDRISKKDTRSKAENVFIKE